MQTSYKIIIFLGALLVLGGCLDGGDVSTGGTGLEVTLDLNHRDIRVDQLLIPTLEFTNYMECDAEVSGEIRDTVPDTFGGIETEQFDFTIEGVQKDGDGNVIRNGKHTIPFQGASYNEGGLNPVITTEVTYKCLDDRGAIATICIDEERCDAYETVNQVTRDNLPIEVGRIDKEFIKTGSGQDTLVLGINLDQKVSDGNPVGQAVEMVTNGRNIGDFDCNQVKWEKDTTSSLVECRLDIDDTKNDVNIDVTLDYEFRVSISKNVNIKNDGSRA